MSHFFFHLKLEVYPTPASTHTNTSSSSSSYHASSAAEPPLVSRPGIDIFSKTALPAHRTSKWPSQTFAKQTPSPTNRSTTPTRLSAFDSPPRYLSPEHDRSNESHGNALLLPERSANLRKDLPPSPRIPVTTRHSNQAAARDWRYDRVEIESIDMEKSKSSTTGGGLHTKAVYVPSESKTTEAGWGVVHLYRDLEESKALDAEGLPQRSVDRGSKAGEQDGKAFDPEDCSTLCILAVPSWMMPSDLLSFLGDQAREDVSHLRLIRTARANKYMVLLKFRSPKKARDWQKANNGRLFSDLEPENCHVVFIKSVEFLSPDEDITAATATMSFPRNTHDPFTATASTGAGSSILHSKPMPPPPPNLLELPTCPVCLERMDETTGLLTILCQHVFHCACLEKWRGSGCPVCRYTHAPSYTFPYPRPGGGEGEEERQTMCSVCAGTSNLWVCLICGNIGCGRYDSAHAYAHYEETSHCYAMDINTQHVWDYAGDGYVHRLIQSKPPTTPAGSHDQYGSGGGYVDMPLRQRHENEAFRAEGGDSVPREKMESMATEYTYLLTSQLEGQRRYFEEQVARAVDKASQASQRAEEAASHASKLEAEVEKLTAKFEDVRAQLRAAETKLDKAEKARAKFESMARDLGNKWREEKTMNEGLVERIRAAEGEARVAREAKERLEREKRELEDVNHDLTMFISGQEKVKEMERELGEEVAEGSAFVPEGQGPKRGGRRKGKGKS